MYVENEKFLSTRLAFMFVFYLYVSLMQLWRKWKGEYGNGRPVV
jgi:hypothetical protein